MIPPNTTPDISIKQINFDRSTGDFNAIAVISAPQMTDITTTIDGITFPEVQTVIATHDLRRGTILNSDDLRLSWARQDSSSGKAIVDISDATGMEVVRSTFKGMPLYRSAVAEPVLIVRGAVVSLAVDLPGLEVTAQGIALASGQAGRVIAVVNPSSHEIVQAVVDGPGHAHVLPGSMPTRSSNVSPYYAMPERSQ
jgi:flagella basal body P-ring formation protein FlgA